LFVHQTGDLIPDGTVGIKTDARYTSDVKPRIVMAKAGFNQDKTNLTSKFDLNLRKKLEESYIWSVVKNWTLHKIDKK